jgi:3-oxoadipate enol-lactonase
LSESPGIAAGAPVEVGELRMHVVDRGTGHPLLLLHGLGADHSVWRHQLAAFAGGHRCIAPDTRGAGRSSRPPEEYSIELFADDVAALCARLGVEHAHVIGQSQGGMIAQQLAARHPQLVDGIVLVGTSGRAVAPAERPLGPVEAAASSGGMAAVAPLVRDLVYTPEFQRTHAAEVEAFAQVLAACDPADVVAKLRASATLDHTALLPTLDVPALVVAGSHDGVFPLEHSTLLAELLPAAQLVVFEDSGHQPHVDHPVEFNRVVGEFLAAHPCTRSAR